MAKEKQKTEEHTTIIITETPSIPKLTRAKARELNKTPILKLPALKTDQESEPEIAALIKDDLHSDEDDEEYVFQEEDFVVLAYTWHLYYTYEIYSFFLLLVG